jgi:hypothetical protein
MPLTTLVTPRDLDIFLALDRSPLTARQLLKASQTFTQPFTSERCVRERLSRLCAAGRVRRWTYATAGRGALGYYVLARLGYHLLHGADAVPPKRIGGPVALARQPHTQALADFIVHTAVLAHQSNLLLTDFYAENTLCLRLGTDCLYPDGAFRLRTIEGRTFSFFVELDNGTQPIHSPKDVESWQRKLQFYQRFQDQAQERFRVLLISTRSQQRLEHLLTLAARLATIPQRSLCYGGTLAAYLASANSLTHPCLHNHRGEPVSLIRRLTGQTLPLVPATSENMSAMVFSTSCR